MNHQKEESSDDILKPKYAKPSEREDEEVSLPPLEEPNEGEQQLEEEQNTSPAGEEEEWEDELTGEKIDNQNLPSQRLAEFGMEEDLYPPRI